MGCPGRPSGPKGRGREGPRAPVGGSVTAASEKWALKCVSGLGGREGRKGRSGQGRGRDEESQVPWVGRVERKRERKGRKERL